MLQKAVDRQASVNVYIGSSEQARASNVSCIWLLGVEKTWVGYLRFMLRIQAI